MQKIYYTIGEVSKLIDEEQHILRYWEKEFKLLSPKKNRAGNRSYTQRDLAIIKLIKKLLRGNKFSLKGAQEYLNQINIRELDSEEIIKLIENQSGNLFSHDQQSDSNQIHSEINRELLIEYRGLLKEILAYLK